jgi:acid phosphatase type 7
MPYSERTTHTGEITGLQSGATYRFRFGPDSKTYTFRTMPARADRPIRFATGGDTMHRKEWLEKTNRQALKYDPDFVMLGGDLAYENGDPKQVQRIYDWLDACKSTLVTAQGRVVPIVVTLGNHEVQGGFGKTAEQAPYFHNLFPFPGSRGYNVLDFGDYMSVIVLDSGHTAPIAGAQTMWLSQTLESRRDVPHKFPVYHVASYPSVRKFEEGGSPLIRQNWAPLFEKYGVRVAFENHDHAYKRTHPIRSGQVDYAHGVMYLGDGAWGVTPRDVHSDSWYLAKTASVRHFILVTLQGQHEQFRVIDEEGNTIDQYPSAP